jgi:hypothetical protein
MKPPVHRYSIVCLLVASLAVPASYSSVLFAQEMKARDPAAAEALFLQGRTALEAGNFEVACVKFAESQRLDPGAGTLMNLATCEEQVGRLASAWQRWQEALTYLPKGDERIAFVKSRLEVVEPAVPWLTITVTSAPDSTIVLRDGVQLGPGSFGEALPVDPGDHVILVQAEGHAERRYQVTLDKAERKQIEVKPGRLLPKPLPADTGDTAPSAPTLGYVLGGIGIAGVAAGIVTGLMISDRQQVVDANCNGALCTQAGLDAASEGRTLLIANAAAWVAGVVGLGAGGYLVLSHDSGRASQSVGIVSVPGGAGLLLRGKF